MKTDWILGRTVLGLVLAGIFTMAGAQEDSMSDKGWKESLGDIAFKSVDNIEEFADVMWRRFANRVGLNQPRYIAAYHGYGNGERIWIRGRLLADRPIGGPQEDNDWWDNLQATYGRWDSDEIPNATIDLTYRGQQVSVETDGEGYYQAIFETAPTRAKADSVLAEHVVEDRVLTALHRVSFPGPQAEYLIISDMDDTVIHTGITNLLTSARLTFLYNAKTRKPLLGVSALYRAFVAGTSGRLENPIFYVSNSAWNLFDLLRDFIELNDIPPGPLLLRDIGVEHLFSKSPEHKKESVQRLFDRFDDLPAILIGDTGQHDAGIYAEIVADNPGRVLAVYLRDVDPDEDSEFDAAADSVIDQNRRYGVPFLRVVNSYEIAEHALELGLIPREVLPAIAAETEVDRQRETVGEAATAEEGD